MTTGIYCIENTVSSKKYVGMAQNIEARWRTHKCELRKNKHVNRHLQNAWNKYGENAFEFYVIEEAKKEDLSTKEKIWIDKLGTAKHGYNLTLGGEGQYGRFLTDEQKKHLSIINTGEKNPNFGLKRSEETRRKMSEAMKGKKRGRMSKRQRDAISKGNKGKKRPWFNKAVIHVETGETYENISTAAEKTGLSISGISRVCRGDRKSIHKQHFQFLEA